MRYAIIENGVVDNIAEGSYPLEVNWEEIPIGMTIVIGDTYDTGCFYSPDGELRLTPELQELIETYTIAYNEGVQNA